MKNFKKVLALVLALATLLSFATVASAAVDTTSIYADADDVKYVEAVDVLTAIGVLNGKGASYKPNDTLKRSEAAKIIAMFDNGDTEISKLYNPANTFVDVASDYWAISYIAYCAKQGIISGVGNNKYAPESKLTGIQFLKMVLVTLGYDAKEEGLVGTSWKVNVLKLARAAGLTDVLGKSYDYDTELTRDAAAQIMLNALNAKTVSYGQEIKTSGSKSILTTAGAVENDSYLYESWDLVKQEDKDDVFGRPCHIWKLEKDTIGTYVKDALASYTVEVTGSDIINDCDFDDDGVKLSVYVDGVKDDDVTVKNSTDSKFGAQGRLTQVYEDRIVYIDTFLAKVTKVVTEKRDAKDRVTRKAQTTVDVYVGSDGDRFDEASDPLTATFETDAFAVDDMVLVTGKVTPALASATKIAIETMETADIKIAEFTKIKKIDGEYSQVALDGEFADIACTYFFDGIDPENLGSDMIAYFDAYGNVIGMEVYNAPLNYAVIDALWLESVKGKATIKADLVTAAGEKLEDVEISSVTVNENFFNGTAGGDDTEFDAEEIYNLGDAATNVVFAKNSKLNYLYNELFAYTTEDGTYSLTLHGCGTWVDATYKPVTTGNSVKFSNGSSYVKSSTGEVLFQITDETLVLVREDDSATKAPYGTYKSYTGYDEIPSMTGDVQYHVNKDSNKVDVVYVSNVTVSGTETVIFFAEADRYATKDGSNYNIEFEAYALDEDTGTLTKATYYFVSTDKNELKSMGKGFYKVAVKDNNEIQFLDGTATLIEESETVEQGTSTATGKTDEKGNYIEAGGVKVDGGDADVVTYVLDGSDLKDGNFADLANGDTLYVFKSDSKFTIVNASELAEIVVVDEAGEIVLGVTTSDEIVGHTWEALSISGIPEGMEVDKVSQGADSENAEEINSWGNSNAKWAEDDSDVTVSAYIKVALKWENDYTIATLQTPVNGLGTVAGTTITAYSDLEYSVAELLDVLKAGLAADVATVEVQYAGKTESRTSSRMFTSSNKSGWTVIVTAGNGKTQKTYNFSSGT